MRWDPDEDAPKGTLPSITTVNAWEIEELEDESDEEDAKAAVKAEPKQEEHLTSGTLSHVSVEEETPRRKRKADELGASSNQRTTMQIL